MGRALTEAGYFPLGLGMGRCRAWEQGALGSVSHLCSDFLSLTFVEPLNFLCSPSGAICKGETMTLVCESALRDVGIKDAM